MTHLKKILTMAVIKRGSCMMLKGTKNLETGPTLNN